MMRNGGEMYFFFHLHTTFLSAGFHYQSNGTRVHIARQQKFSGCKTQSWRQRSQTQTEDIKHTKGPNLITYDTKDRHCFLLPTWTRQKWHLAATPASASSQKPPLHVPDHMPGPPMSCSGPRICAVSTLACRGWSCSASACNAAAPARSRSLSPLDCKPVQYFMKAHGRHIISTSERINLFSTMPYFATSRLPSKWQLGPRLASFSLRI